MFDLKSIQPTRKDTPSRILIHGQHKVGKSTWAAGAESPIFIATEEGQDAIDAQAFPLCKTWADVLGCVTSLYQEEHKFKTVVLDSGDWAETLAQKHACAQQEKKSIEDFGYGKGYTFAADIFRELIDGLDALRSAKQMQVIIICHSEIRRFDDPLADSYDRYGIKMHKMISKLVQEWADVIAFAQPATTTKTEDKGFNKKRTRALDLNSRVLHLNGSPAFDAGNRYDLPPVLPLIWGEFEAALKAAKATGK
jgi:hypothetical protein